jgi:saccharopine dehydrogenase-like NADP-dependent oxidoreductase
MRIVVLGGAGKMGCIAVQTLAGDDRVEQVVLADLNMDQAKNVANIINSPKIEIKSVDVNDKAGILEVLDGAHACLNATVYYTNLLVMETCLEAGVPYTDMGGLFHITRKQLELHDRFREAGVSAVLCMGSAPGIPNLQARYAADRLDRIDSIRIFDGIKPPAPDDPRFSYAVPTIIDELTVEPMVFENGEFLAKPPLSEFEDYLFTEPLGILPMHLSLHSEVATLPITFKDQGIQECFFKINYWGMAKNTIERIKVLADYGFASKESVEVRGVSVVPRDLLVAMLAGYVPDVADLLAPAQAQPPDWTKEIVTEIRGSKDGKDVMYRLGTLTCKGALPTGAAPAIAAIWLAEGRIEPGVYPPEACLDPEPFFKELEAYDIVTQVAVTNKV